MSTARSTKDYPSGPPSRLVEESLTGAKKQRHHHAMELVGESRAHVLLHC